jgi:hypothetical protein
MPKFREPRKLQELIFSELSAYISNIDCHFSSPPPH